MKQVKQVVMLPTEKASRIFIGVIASHIYFTDNFEIKEGDWCLDSYNKEVIKAPKGGFKGGVIKKIISSTDKEITPNNWIPESFVKKYIEMYNAGTPIAEVNVEYHDIGEEDWIGDGYHGEPFWNENIVIKTRENGSIIISQSRPYSREEVSNIIHEAIKFALLNPEIKEEEANKFIEEHL